MMQPVPKPRPAHKGPRSIVGRLNQNALDIVILESALEQILEYSEQDLTRELGGFLLGGYFLDGTPYVEVRHFLEAVESRSGAVSLTFTHATWANATRDVSVRFPDDVIIGWHHTHPQLRVFLSGYDMFIHRHFFKQPWQIAMVVDPVLQEFGFFQWCGSQIVDCGFHCIRGQ